jgi:hypothetical protein
VEYTDGEIHIVIHTEDFMYKDVSASKAALGTRLEKFFGANVRVRVSLAGSVTDAPTEQDAVTTPGSAESASVPSERKAITAPEERSSVERMLVDMFGAKKIPMPGTS